jgi:sulfofructose kinase
MSVIVCVGHSAFDRVYNIDAVVAPPAKLRAVSYREMGGGMAGNAAVAVAHLGGHARFWGPAGDDETADRMADDFARHGVDATQMRRFAGATSSHSAILVDAQGERLIVNVRGSALEDDGAWLPLHTLSDCNALLADVRWAQGSTRALQEARRRGIPTVLDGDTAPVGVLQAMAGEADWCVFSEPGFAAFAQGASPEIGLAHALERGARIAAVTRGATGTLWMSAEAPGHVQYCPAFTVKAVDTTGAGDAFHGAIALMAAEAVPPEAAFRFASAAAAIKVSRAGARSMPSRGEVESMLSP